MPRNDLIKIRQGTAAAWTSADPTLATGELGFETDTGKFKIGKASTAWTTLVYAAVTTTELTSAINAVINAAPGALDTLDELAAALGDDANFATTIANSLALKAPLVSPAFTGTPTGITKTHVGLGNQDNIKSDILLPSYVTTRSRPHFYDAVLHTYDWRPENTRKLHAALGKAAAGIGGLQHIAVVGDSLSAGYMGSTASPVWDTTKAWPVVLRNLLAGIGIPIGGTGLVPLSDVTQVAADSRWTTTGTWTATGLGYAGTTTNGATATFVSDVPGVAADLYFYGGGGAATWAVDGVPQGSLDMSGGIVLKKATATGLASGLHTIVVTATSTTLRYIVGAQVRAASGLVIHNLSEGSSQTLTWTTTTAGSLYDARFGALALSSQVPAAVLFALGVNDVLNSVPGATFKTRLTTLRNLVSTNSDVAFVGAPCWSNMSDEMFDLADTLDHPFIDVFSRYGGTSPGSPANVNGLVQDGSNVHVNQALQADWGRWIESLIAGGGSTSGGGSGDALTTGTLAQFAPTSSAQLRGVLSDETGSGPAVFGTNPTITNYTEAVVAIGTVTTTSTLDLTNGTVQTATLTASTACTFTMPTPTAGKSFVLLLKQAASTGNGTAVFTGVKWNSVGAPTITATAGKMDILTFVADGASWYGSYAQGFTP